MGYSKLLSVWLLLMWPRWSLVSPSSQSLTSSSSSSSFSCLSLQPYCFMDLSHYDSSSCQPHAEGPWLVSLILDFSWLCCPVLLIRSLSTRALQTLLPAFSLLAFGHGQGEGVATGKRKPGTSSHFPAQRPCLSLPCLFLQSLVICFCFGGVNHWLLLWELCLFKNV